LQARRHGQDAQWLEHVGVGPVLLPIDHPTSSTATALSMKPVALSYRNSTKSSVLIPLTNGCAWSK
jgi:hypothetical protein